MEQVFLAPGPKQSDFDTLSNTVSTLNTQIVRNIPANTDLNSLTTPGYYNTDSAITLTNAPASGTNRVSLLVQKSENGYVFQLATENLQNTYGVYSRRCLNGTWTSWQQVGGSTYSVSVYGLSIKEHVIDGVATMAIQGVTTTAITAWASFATLPSGMRPVQQIDMAGTSIRVGTDGTVKSPSNIASGTTVNSYIMFVTA